MVSVVAIGHYAEEVVDAVIQYNNSTNANHIHYNSDDIERSLLIFVIYTSGDDVNTYLSELPKSQVEHRVIVGVELQLANCVKIDNSIFFDINWRLPYNRNSGLTITAGIKTLLDIGNVGNPSSFSCIDLADIIYTLKDTNITEMLFVSHRSVDNIELMTKQLHNNINIPTESVKCICIYYYLPVNYKLTKHELANSTDNLTNSFGADVDIIFNSNDIYKKNVSNPFITEIEKQNMGIVLLYSSFAGLKPCET